MIAALLPRDMWNSLSRAVLTEHERDSGVAFGRFLVRRVHLLRGSGQLERNFGMFLGRHMCSLRGAGRHARPIVREHGLCPTGRTTSPSSESPDVAIFR